jgi:hypothetical protein
MTWWQWVINIALGLLVPFCGWLVAAIHSQRRELDALKLYVAENYAKNETIDRIETKLDHLNELVNRLVGKLSATP